MKNKPIRIALMGLTVMLAFSSGIYILSKRSLSTIESSFVTHGSGEQKDPCSSIVKKNDPTVAERYTEEARLQKNTYGYAQDVPLREAVQAFNEEHYCRNKDPRFPPLTEEEVMAGAVDELSTYGTAPIDPSFKITSAKRQTALESIWKHKIMPKGALLVAQGQYDTMTEDQTEPVSMGVNCRMIRLYLGLDKTTSEDGFLKPEQVCLIRKTCFGIEKKKRSLN
jgi:hypothetical protein